MKQPVKKPSSYNDELLELYTENGLEGSCGPGFFTTYHTTAQFQTQFKAPVVLPIICLAAALNHIIGAVKSVALSVVNFCVFDREQSRCQLRLASEHLIDGVKFIISAVLLSVVAMLAFIMRALLTILNAPLVLAAACFPDRSPSSTSK